MKFRVILTLIWNYLRLKFRNVYYLYTTFIGRILAGLSGVKLGKNCRFYGKPYFLKARKSNIMIGDNCSFRSSPTSNLIGINRPCMISAHIKSKLIIKKECSFSGVVIGCFSSIIIDESARIGANALITDSDWHLTDKRCGSPKPIYIGKNVWLGVNVTVLKGVSIGMNSVIGANSVVTKNIPDNVIAAGNPCKVIKLLD